MTTLPSEPPIAVSILVVDDRVENRIALRAILTEPDYRIVEAASAREALKQLLDTEFAVLLVDVVMPEMSGLELAALVRKRGRNAAVPILFLTAVATDLEAIYKAYDTGAVDYLVKPLIPEMVQAKVAVFAELYRQRKRLERQSAALVEAVRRANERRYRNLAEAVPNVVWTATPDGTIEYLNARWYEYTGVGDSPGKWMNALHPDDRARFTKLWHEALASGQMLQIECRIRGTDANHHWHLCRAVPDRDAEGEIIGWIGTFTDVDEQKRIQSALAEAIHARDEFLSIASHELRTPITSLQLQVESMLDETTTRLGLDDGDRWTRRIRLAARQVERLTRLVEELLDVSRIATGRLKLAPEENELGSIVSEVASRFQEQASRASSELKLDIKGPVNGCWDRLRLEQVVTNLISNAVKFGAGKPIEIAVDGGRPGSARIIVRDHGIGIAADDVDRIFGRFERAVSSRSYGGLGLGLYIVQQIVDRHGGSVAVKSTPGDGSTFTVELPPEATGDRDSAPGEPPVSHTTETLMEFMSDRPPAALARD